MNYPFLARAIPRFLTSSFTILWNHVHVVYLLFQTLHPGTRTLQAPAPLPYCATGRYRIWNARLHSPGEIVKQEVITLYLPPVYKGKEPMKKLDVNLKLLYNEMLESRMIYDWLRTLAIGWIGPLFDNFTCRA